MSKAKERYSQKLAAEILVELLIRSSKNPGDMRKKISRLEKLISTVRKSDRFKTLKAMDSQLANGRKRAKS